MRIIIHWQDGKETELQHADSIGFTKTGIMNILNASGHPLAMVIPGHGSLVFPEHDTQLLTGGNLLDEQGNLVNLKA